MLEINHLSKHFGKVTAVEDVTIRVAAGETVVLMGPSGCGKSTTIRTVNRLIEADGGAILFCGQDILRMDDEELRQARKKIGFVFQQFNLIGRLTAEENVMLGLVMGGMPRDVATEKAREALRKVGMESHARHKSGEMSGGQQQRVGIARALAFEPELMLWDEPTASLDPILVREVLVVMEELAKYRSSAMLVVTHEIPFALHVADRIVLMEQGKIMEEGIPSEVFVRPGSEIGKKYKELIEYQTNTNVLTLAGKRIA